MSFIDEVMDARAAAHRDEVRAARTIASIFDRAISNLNARVEELRRLERMGMFRSAADLKRMAEAVLAEAEGLAEIAARDAGSLLDFARQQTVRRVLAETTMIAEEAGHSMELATTFAQIPVGQVAELAQRPIMGVTAQEAMDNVAGNMVENVREAMMSGIVEGKSMKDIARDVAEEGEMTEAAAARVTRTNMSASANDALRALYEANDELIDGYTWDATLDERVCVRCGALHGTFYELGSKPPGPPLHPNCRCTLTPHVRDEGEPDEEEYRRARPLLESGERSRETELIPRDQRFEAWLRGQPAGATSQVTGSELKDDLWRRGKLPFTELVRPDTTTRTDEDALRRALSLKPGDAWLRAKARELGVSPVTEATIRREDSESARSAPFTLGKRAGLSRELSALRERVDEAKRARLARTDAVVSGARSER